MLILLLVFLAIIFTTLFHFKPTIFFRQADKILFKPSLISIANMHFLIITNWCLPDSNSSSSLKPRPDLLVDKIKTKLTDLDQLVTALDKPYLKNSFGQSSQTILQSYGIKSTF
jgi:hypothetical protein